MINIALGNFLTDLLGKLDTGLPFWMLVVVAGIAGFTLVIGGITVVVMFSIWLERKVAGHIQCRYGPMYVGGWHGWAQSIADGVKLLIKEDIIPAGADKKLFIIAPALVLASALAAFVAVPLAPGIAFADIDLGAFFIVSISSLTTIGVIMAGWASNNKWSVLGGMRQAAQVVAYEIPLGLALMSPVIVTGTFSLREACEMQSGWWGMQWLIFQNPFMLPAFILFFIGILAETKRAPFDLAEAESELVAGFHTEYSGIRWSIFFLEEYAAMFIMSAIAAAFFLGGWNFPGIQAVQANAPMAVFQAVCAVVFVIKAMLLMFVMIWLRWTLPRIRIDQIMTMGYKYLTPLALGCLLGAAVWELYVVPIFKGHP